MKEKCVFYFDGNEEVSYDDGCDFPPQFRVECKYNEYEVDISIHQWRNGDFDEEFDIRGHIKSDGCSNWETNHECMLHICGIEGWAKLNNLMVFLYEKAEMYFEEKGVR